MPKGIYEHKPHQGFQKGHLYLNTGKTRFKIGNHPKTEFKKGQHFSPQTEFKKGIPAWNKDKILPQFSRENAGHWKGGVIKNKAGYVFIYRPEHPYCDSKGYIHRSRLVMEQSLGRYLKPEEVVHHINGVKDDDHIENLQLFPNNREHSKHHKFGVKE